MKQFAIILFAVVLCTTATAQKNFQGSVIYRLHSEEGKKPDAELKVLFGEKKLKLLFKEKGEYDNDALVVILDSAAAYTVNFKEKTFKKRALLLTSTAETPVRKTIAGYTTTPLQFDNNSISALLGGFMNASYTIFYLADSLYYYIPGMYASNRELIMIQKNRIVLGAEIQILNPLNEIEDSAARNKNIITAEAVEIKPMLINEAEFLIPADFADRKNSSEYLPVDSAMAELDSLALDTIAVAPPPVKKDAKKPPVKPRSGKTKGPAKAAARKDG